jgi:D-alanyl-D-alanine carboxypeptidase/D-alanyl-D-alanine-endopeptidase (penicillin-binding protein 4)
VDGTAARLKDRNPQSPVIGNAWLKTGSLRDVASVAGYVQGQSGQRYTLVAVLNHPNANQARPALDQLLEWTVRDTAGAIPSASRPNPKFTADSTAKATRSPAVTPP